MRGGNEGDGGHDDLVAGTDAGEDRREIERGGCAIETDGMGGAEVGGEVRFKLGGPGAEADPAALEHLANGVAFLLAHAGSEHRQHDSSSSTIPEIDRDVLPAHPSDFQPSKEINSGVPQAANRSAANVIPILGGSAEIADVKGLAVANDVRAQQPFARHAQSFDAAGNDGVGLKRFDPELIEFHDIEADKRADDPALMEEAWIRA